MCVCGGGDWEKEVICRCCCCCCSGGGGGVRSCGGSGGGDGWRREGARARVAEGVDVGGAQMDVHLLQLLGLYAVELDERHHVRVLVGLVQLYQRLRLLLLLLLWLYVIILLHLETSNIDFL